jgi:exocyst complex protein 7
MMKVKTHAFRQAHENIDNTLKAAEVVLTQFDVPRQVLIISQTLVVVVIAVVSGPM